VAGDGERRFPGPTGNVQHAVAGLDTRQLYQGAAYVPRTLINAVSPALPGKGSRVPVLALSSLVLGRVELRGCYGEYLLAVVSPQLRIDQIADLVSKYSLRSSVGS
jgi:hypothetical protein